ncbi:MAG: nicotinate (nicotinamide) nucleotide adenylyltransferase [Ruminococcaceae bacterium]|nr:nicotinate (nicotinamide) nucleotide adenylyltransferase [Oscillospiraceae bacterium]
MGFTAVFGGTFNPLHKGHYEMLEALQKDQSITEIWIMPDRIPPHKECDYMASDTDRINMCNLVSKDFSKATVCLVEFEREGKSYTYDTMVELCQKLPQKDFVFVCGGDMFLYFPKWYRYKDLMKLLPFYVFSRATDEKEAFENAVKEFSAMGMKLIFNNAKISNISSTEFRNSKNEKLLPKKIYDYIKEKGIYDVR